MFNSYSVTPRVDARTTNNIKFDAVSGTVYKSHPKSTFIWFELGSKIEKWVMGADPSYCFSDEKEYFNGHFDWKLEPIIVLQIMLTGENRVIAEIVSIEDLEMNNDA